MLPHYVVKLFNCAHSSQAEKSHDDGKYLAKVENRHWRGMAEQRSSPTGERGHDVVEGEDGNTAPYECWPASRYEQIGAGCFVLVYVDLGFHQIGLGCELRQ